MQKIFIKYTSAVMAIGFLLILSVNFIFTIHILEEGQFNSFHTKMNQVEHTLENNEMEMELIRENLDTDYLTRARAAAYILDNQRYITLNVFQMQYLTKLLDVDELHIIDENGIIVSGSVLKYVGMDMSQYEQTRPFYDLLKSGEADDYLIQDALPNAAEGKIMKYVGIVRKDGNGIAQVGFAPTRQLEAESRNSYDYIFSKFPTDVGEELFILNVDTGEVLGHSSGMDQEFSEECYQIDELLNCAEGAYKKGKDGKTMYVVSRKYGDMLIGAALPRDILYKSLWRNILLTLFYLLIIGITVIIILNHLLKRKVISGIHGIIENLYSITNGNLDVKVSEEGNREFKELSRGINTMVRSIIRISDRISAIIETSGIPLAAFEYKRGEEDIFITSGLKELLDISEEEADKLYKDSSLFDEYIHKVTENPIEGETNIYKIGDTKYVRINMSDSGEGYLGVITDATEYVKEKQKLQYENTHDHLTGLHKYSYFKRLAAETLHNMAEEQICAVVMMDLDSFKSINDTFGHDMGDKYLQSFSDIINSLPKEHVITARRSGDEFCMMIHDCKDKSEIRGYLDLLYELLAQNPVILSEEESRTVNVSCGFAWTADTGAELKELLAHADEALYEMKRETKGRYREYNENA